MNSLNFALAAWILYFVMLIGGLACINVELHKTTVMMKEGNARIEARLKIQRAELKAREAQLEIQRKRIEYAEQHRAI